MQKQPFKRANAIMSALASIAEMSLSSFERDAMLAKIPEYRSKGKGKGKSWHAEKGKTARIKRASVKKRNIEKRK